MEIWLAFTAGLATSLHCIGMCGGIVTAIALAGDGKGAAERVVFSLSYHLGRVLTYSLLGAFLGLAAEMAMLTPFKSHLRWIFLAANVAVIITGLATAIGVRQFNLFSLDGDGGSFFRRPLLWITKGGSPFAGFPIGLIMGLLPCGLLYGVLAIAATTGSWIMGGSVMLAFGLGTVPLLLLLGGGVGWLRSSVGELFVKIMGGSVALLGLAGLWRVLSKMGYMPAPPFF